MRLRSFAREQSPVSPVSGARRLLERVSIGRGGIRAVRRDLVCGEGPAGCSERTKGALCDGRDQMRPERRRSGTGKARTATEPPCPVLSDGAQLRRAEDRLLQIADLIYAQTSVKPMSKALFLLSRCLLLLHLDGKPEVAALASAYARVRSRLGPSAPADDYDLASVVAECGSWIETVMGCLDEVCAAARGTDCLGLAFDALLRGKFESGEGLGTHLTPEEIVEAMVQMGLDVLGTASVAAMLADGRGRLLVGDICGGTGRFTYRLARKLRSAGLAPQDVARCVRLFDQSRLAVGFAELNFVFDGLRADIRCVGDSLTAPEVTELAGRFVVLATNPPFGTGKYCFHPELLQSLRPALLAHLGLRRQGDTADPAELFLYRNLDLLLPGGVLAIVLPDGILRSDRCVAGLHAYESLACCSLAVHAVVSLPAVSFALGGTVAKTSFLVIQKLAAAAAAGDRRPTYAAVVEHVGFVKRGNRRDLDRHGNQLTELLCEFRAHRSGLGRWVLGWHSCEDLCALGMLHARPEPAARESAPASATRLRDAADEFRVYRPVVAQGPAPRFHLSILDVDETGLIDVVAASTNDPVTRPLLCKAGDVLLSCINPRIWRVAVVPSLAGEWTCSSEYMVLRPRKAGSSWRLFLSLHHKFFIERVRAMAGGTSSSRQRVNRARVMQLLLPPVNCSDTELRAYAASRESLYEARLREARAIARLHAGEGAFRLTAPPAEHPATTPNCP
jgi:hypothetical protein